MLNDVIELTSTATYTAERLRARLAARDVSAKAGLGQFMTPSVVASFMADMFDKTPRVLRLLDAGAGVGALSAAAVSKAVRGSVRPEKIEVTAFEVDPTLVLGLQATLQQSQEEARAAGVKMTFKIHTVDFIEASTSLDFLDARSSGLYNWVILNPPYKKLNSESAARTALRSVGVETSNFYSAFVVLAARQLAPDGQLVAITPRSFCNGVYFKPFREELLSAYALTRVHVYDSRQDAFSDDDVLQENIIFCMSKTELRSGYVTISTSHSPADLNIRAREVPFEELVVPGDRHQFIRLPQSVTDAALAEAVRTLPATLESLGFNVSTGRVVDFRALDLVRPEETDDAVPLIYPAHFDDGLIKWPVEMRKKSNVIKCCDESMKLLVRAGFYTLTKRFSSKEEKRRITAAVFDPTKVECELVGFENHVNYFHKAGRALEEMEAKGLTIYLNSAPVDQYFRQFSGHTQVNATDLRNLHYPCIGDLLMLGAEFSALNSDPVAANLAIQAILQRQ